MPPLPIVSHRQRGKHWICRELAHSRLGDPAGAYDTGRITPSRVLAHQASDTTALIAKLHEVARVVMISSPTDGLIDLDDGARMVEIGATPPDRHYGLAHQQEFPIRPIFANWNKLGLGVFGPPVVPETSEPPYSGTHMLLTNLPPSTGVLNPNSAHCLTANDSCTPLAADGTPALRDAWRYISGQPGK